MFFFFLVMLQFYSDLTSNNESPVKIPKYKKIMGTNDFILGII